MEEVWKDIEGYEGYFQISNFARVKSLDRWVKHSIKGKFLKRGKMRKISKSNNGYAEITLRKEGTLRTFMVHVLVGKYFVPNPKNYPVLNHKDENPMNPKADNLEWCTYSYNSMYGTCRERRKETYGIDNLIKHANELAKLKRKKVFQFDLNGNFIKEWESTRECGRNGFGQVNVAACCRGEYKQHKGYIWRYLDAVSI